MDKADTPAHTDRGAAPQLSGALRNPAKGVAVMIRRALVVAALAAASLAPLAASSPANAIPICKGNYGCYYTYYSTIARTTIVGAVDIPCGGRASSWGEETAYFNFSEAPCN
jgi:hypothetical protein